MSASVQSFGMAALAEASVSPNSAHKRKLHLLDDAVLLLQAMGGGVQSPLPRVRSFSAPLLHHAISASAAGATVSDRERTASEHSESMGTSSTVVGDQMQPDGRPQHPPEKGQGGEVAEPMIGSMTRTERRAYVDRYLVKRARQRKLRAEGKLHKYKGRTKFANSRRRVKGRFISLKFLEKEDIRFVSEKSGWVCGTLGGQVFEMLEDALKATAAEKERQKALTPQPSSAGAAAGDNTLSPESKSESQPSTDSSKPRK